MTVKFNAKPTQVTTARNYRKAYMKLLTAATGAPKVVDEYFFGPADDRDEESSEVRPYAYAFVSFCMAIGIFILTQY